MNSKILFIRCKITKDIDVRVFKEDENCFPYVDTVTICEGEEITIVKGRRKDDWFSFNFSYFDNELLDHSVNKAVSNFKYYNDESAHKYIDTHNLDFLLNHFVSSYEYSNDCKIWYEDYWKIENNCKTEFVIVDKDADLKLIKDEDWQKLI